MPDRIKLPKHLVLELTGGGPQDGTYDIQSADQNVRQFAAFAWLCTEGKIGKGFKGASPYGIEQFSKGAQPGFERSHRYILERHEGEGDDITIHMVYRPELPTKASDQ
jgi:hypothetical protein